MKPKFAMYWAASCGGCEIAVLKTDAKVLDLDAHFDVAFWPAAMDPKYRDLEAMEDASLLVALFHRGIRTEENEHMARLLRHRGPDGEGTFIDGPVGLAHRRLAIIDLSEAAAQPMANEDGTLRLVYNGEIYNYLELREELRAKGHRFNSEGDAEVILHAYEEWGRDCLSRFTGMWAFALLVAFLILKP